MSELHEQSTEQIEKPEPLETAIADTWDKLEAGSPEEETETTDGEEVEISQETTEEVTEENEAEQVEAQGDEATEQVAEAEPDYDEPAPERWNPEMKEVYRKLPPEAKQMMLEQVFKPMQREYTKSTQQISEMRKQVEPLMHMMEETRGDFERAGMNPEEAIRRQVAWSSHFLKVGAEQGMKDMAASYGLNQNTDNGNVEEYMTPVERQLKAQADRIEANLNQQSQANAERTQTQQQEASQQRYQEAHKSLNEFINEQKDGKPAHPHVEKVAPAIAGLIKGGLVTQVDDYGQPVPFQTQIRQAYNMACEMDSSIRSASVKNTQQEQVDRVKAAQDVNVVTTMPSGQPSNVPAKPLAADIEDIYDTLSRRAG